MSGPIGAPSVRRRRARRNQPQTTPKALHRPAALLPSRQWTFGTARWLPRADRNPRPDFFDIGGFTASNSSPISSSPNSGGNGARGHGAGWSSPVARQAHNLKVRGSNPSPRNQIRPQSHRLGGRFRLWLRCFFFARARRRALKLAAATRRIKSEAVAIKLRKAKSREGRFPGGARAHAQIFQKNQINRTEILVAEEGTRTPISRKSLIFISVGRTPFIRV